MPIKVDLGIGVSKQTLKVERIRDKFWNAIRLTAIQATQSLKTSKLMPVNTGALRASISRRDDRAALRIFIGSSLRYAIVMEQGRRPGKKPPPIEPIAQWIIRKGIAEGTLQDVEALGKRKPRAERKEREKRKPRKAKKLGARLIGPQPKGDLKSVAFLISRSIGKRGSPIGKEGKGHRFFRITARKIPAAFRKNLALELGRP